jgi:hypothetical protein
MHLKNLLQDYLCPCEVIGMDVDAVGLSKTCASGKFLNLCSQFFKLFYVLFIANAPWLFLSKDIDLHFYKLGLY